MREVRLLYQTSIFSKFKPVTMFQSVLKPILFGVLFGALAFLMPFFLLKVIFFFLIVGALFRFWGRRRFGPRAMMHRFAFADKIRAMNEEEYEAFKKRFQEYHFSRGCGRKAFAPNVETNA